MSKDLLLFVAVLPDPEIQAEATAFKEYALERFRSGRALRSPPHITLIPPFKWAPDRVPALRDCLQRFAGKCRPFHLTLRNFNCFRPRVIYIDVEKSQPLADLQTAMADELATELDLRSDRSHPFHAHLTVAFKDLKRSVFPAAWAYFSQQEYERIFPVDQFHLLRHDGRRWNAEQAFPFGKPS